MKKTQTSAVRGWPECLSWGSSGLKLMHRTHRDESCVVSGEAASPTLKCLHHTGGRGSGTKLLGSLTGFAWELGSPVFSGFRALRLAE